jgi:ComF family protein
MTVVTMSLVRGAFELGKGCLGKAVDVVLPRLCFSCAAPLADKGLLCADCWLRVAFISAPACALCGLPFDYDQGPEALCGACIRRRPAYDRARAVFGYDQASKHLVLRFKHADRVEAASTFGRWLAGAGTDFKGDDVVIAPVPLHWRRLLERRYNQAAMLAEALHRVWGCGRLQPDLLERRIWRGSQGGLSATQRRRNVRNAFAVTARRRRLVEGRRVVLVDDVMASGATADAAARTLKRAGAGAVDVAVLARVLKPER